MPASEGRRRLRFFINSSLSSLAEQRLNAELADVVEQASHSVYLPQRELPLGTRASPAEILEANSAAVRASDAVLVVLDKPGLGVAFELGVAFAVKKRIVLFRTDTQDYLGKILEGLWQSHERDLRATSVEELRVVLSRLSSWSTRELEVVE